MKSARASLTLMKNCQIRSVSTSATAFQAKYSIAYRRNADLWKGRFGGWEVGKYGGWKVVEHDPTISAHDFDLEIKCEPQYVDPPALQGYEHLKDIEVAEPTPKK